jgi:hypothetical protein
MTVTARVVMVPQDEWLPHVNDGVRELFHGTLGPAMLDDSRRSVPILSGRLYDSLDFQVLGDAGTAPELQLGSYPDEEGPVEYDLAVELGFRGQETVREHERDGHVVREFTREGFSPEQPYLRSSLYRTR